MDPDRTAPALAGQGSDSARLESWKAIAAYLDRGVTTVQRWEREEGLPVRRHAHGVRGSVFAFRADIDAWRRSREAAGSWARLQQDASLPAPSADVAAGRGYDVLTSAGVQASARWLVPGLWAVGVALVVLAVGVLAATRRSSTGLEPPLDVRPAALTDDDALERHPSLSPDGRFVAYARFEGESANLYLKPTGAGSARQLPIDEHDRTPRTDAHPHWSPDGRRLAFLREVRTSTWQIRIVDAGGGASRGLSVISTAAIAWMPDGRSLVALDRESQSDPYAGYLVSAETGARLRRVTSPPSGTFGDWQCALSPDGRELAVVRFHSRFHADVWVVDLASGAERRVTNGQRDIEGLVWAPDGRAIVFAAANGEGTALFSVSALPGRTMPPALVPHSEGARWPTASRDRSVEPARLAYADIRRVKRRWTLDASLPGAPIEATGEVPTMEEQPVVSPDGTQLAYVSAKSGTQELWVAPVRAGAGRQLTFGSHRPSNPRWSRDGRYLVYAATIDGGQDIFTARADGAEAPWRLTFEPSDESLPSWSHDRRWVYFRSDRSGTPRIWRMPAAGGQAVAVTRGAGSQAIEAPDGHALYFTRGTNVPGLWAIADGHPERLVLEDVWEGRWDVTTLGIVDLLHRGRAIDGHRAAVRVHDPRTRQSRVSMPLPTPFSAFVWGFSASTDGRVVLWTTIDRRRSDLMIFGRWPPQS